MPERDPIRSQGDLVIDVEPADGGGGPWSYKSQRTQTPFSVTGSGDFVVRTGEVERLRITSSGTVLGSGPLASTGLINAKDSLYGAKGDGVTDDTASIQSALAAQTLVSNSVVYLPAPGPYKTTLNPTTVGGPIRGDGQLITSDNNKHGKWFSEVTAPPASLGNWTGVTTAFNGDLSKVQIAMEHRVTGATTLGQPVSGSLDVREAAPIDIYLYNESGWNQSTTIPDGRTEVAALYVKADNNGQGDVACYNANSFVLGTLKPGSSTFLTNPAGVLYNGGVFAGQSGVYLNPVEFSLNDQGFDVAGNGLVINFNRSVNTGALEAEWNGVRLQNSGSKPLDVGFMLINGGSGNGAQVGIDLSAANFPTTGTWVNAAVTLKANQRIYFDATGTDVGASIYRRPSGTGSTYVVYDGSTFSFVISGGVPMQLQSGLTIFGQSINLAAGRIIQVNSTQVVQARQTGWTAATNTKTRTTFDTTTVTLPVLAAHVGALIDDLISHGLIGT